MQVCQVRHVRVLQRVLGALVKLRRVIPADQQRDGEPVEFHGRIIPQPATGPGYSDPACPAADSRRQILIRISHSPD